MPVIPVFAMRSKRINNLRTFSASYRIWGATGDTVSKQEQQKMQNKPKRLLCFSGYARNRAQDFICHWWLLLHHWATVTYKYNGHFLLKLVLPTQVCSSSEFTASLPCCSTLLWLQGGVFGFCLLIFFTLWKCRKIGTLIDPSKTV